jgi:alpha-tubulin suppressor-like RCC1 family protein
MAITNDGTLWAWGSNATGKLGDGTAESQLSPIKIMDDVVTISASGLPATGMAGNTLAIRSDGTLWGWGFGMNSGPIPYHKNTWYWWNPVPGKILEDVEQIVRGTEVIYAITSDGNLWNLSNDVAWVMDEVVAVSTGMSNTLAIRTDGSLWGWEVRWFDPVYPEKVMENVMMPYGKTEAHP